MLEWKRICCGTDFSEGARIAVRGAAELAVRLGAELHLVHVHAPGPAVDTDLVVATPGVEARELIELDRELDDWRSDAERRAARPVHAMVISGDPAEELSRYAHEQGCDLVVVGTHGRRGLRRLVLGSVAERVMREAPCPVLVIRPEGPGLELGIAEEAADYQ